MDVLSIFYEISKIPRGSGNEKAVSDYIKEYALKKGAEAIQDEWNNLIIKKAGNDKPPIILQAHLDMVCEKNAGTSHDFSKDAIDVYVEDDFVKARGTTLGADNGIGVALCLALLDESDLPPLEIVLTTEEETGMSGAENLDVGLLGGTRMLNLDSSEETTFTTGCAAGTTIEFDIPIERTSCENMKKTEISVKGLKGGHSGGDIDKERGNALRILAFLLEGLDVKIIEIHGGMKVNAIPREAFATVAFDGDIFKALEERCDSIGNQFKIADPCMVFSWDCGVDFSDEALTKECTEKVISSLLLFPNGVSAYSLEINGLVNASCNIGIAETTDTHVRISAMARGASEFYTRQAEAQVSALASLVGADARFLQRSPAWKYNPESGLLHTAKNIYKNVFKREAEVYATHGGLECGIFSKNFADKGIELDIISLGPNSYDYHTPDERLSISSTERVWEFLLALLRAL